ncbi:MAG: pilin [Patescibacteria group bacterium]|nr:pilin [Patescibacteria group bacterium]
MIFKKHLFSITILFALLGGLICVLMPFDYINAQCEGGAPDANCNYSAGENMFNCPSDCKPAGIPDKTVEDVIEDAVKWILGFAVAISIVMLVYGGLYYVSSSGDTERAATSKKIIKYALLGVAIAGSSYAILYLINHIIG